MQGTAIPFPLPALLVCLPLFPPTDQNKQRQAWQSGWTGSHLVTPVRTLQWLRAVSIWKRSWHGGEGERHGNRSHFQTSCFLKFHQSFHLLTGSLSGVTWQDITLTLFKFSHVRKKNKNHLRFQVHLLHLQATVQVSLLLFYITLHQDKVASFDWETFINTKPGWPLLSKPLSNSKRRDESSCPKKKGDWGPSWSAGPFFWTFCDTVVAFSVCYAIVCWRRGFTDKGGKKLDKLVRSAQKDVG